MFRRKPAVSEDMADWIAACFGWFDTRFPPPAKPILPTKDFFTAPGGTGPETAKAVLTDIKRLMHYLLPFARPPGDLRHSYQTLAEIGGTYQEGPDGRVIHYDPEAMANPIAFISTLAHEVMHARLSGLQHQVPGGEGAHELATDLGCIIAGFGVFQIQGADDTGWSGYLSQEARAHALAVFLADRGLGADAVTAHLSGRCQRYLKRALRDLTR